MLPRHIQFVIVAALAAMLALGIGGAVSSFTAPTFNQLSEQFP